MKLRLLLIAFLAMYVTEAAFAQTSKAVKSKTEKVTQHRIVYDIVSADSAQQGKIMKHLEKMLNHWPDAKIEMVVHGKGLDMLVQDRSVVTEDLKALQAKGVVFAACENAMRGHNIRKEQLLPGVITVPMGIVEIIEKQEAGWSYIKL